MVFSKSPQNDHFLFARYLFPNGNKNSATIFDFKIITMLLEENIYMINDFDTEKQCFQKWKQTSATIYCIIIVRNTLYNVYYMTLNYKNVQNENV